MKTLKWYSKRQVAEMTGFSVRTVDRWLASGMIKGQRVKTPGGKQWTIRIAESEILKVMGT